MSFSLPSFAKINLYLRILGKRPDGFHELCTIFQTVSLHDTITFSEAEKLEMTCPQQIVPTDGRNLIIRSALALQAASGTRKGAHIELDKRIPTPGGLGGGSSNAATALIGLSRLWKLELLPARLEAIARELGSDVPFFLEGGTAVGTGRGDIVESMSDVTGDNILIVSPEIRVATKDAFAGSGAEALTSEGRKHSLTVCRKEAASLDLRHSVLINDLEPTVFAVHPEIERVKHTLLELGAVNAAMSGSGASVFAIFDKQETRQAAEKALDRENSWRRFAVSTISRDQYREALKLER
ncbi:MAG: 4-(cytidine 5'-diphospho)-2-C-methyl-D-erythritol kinase [Acidobacteria bacterium]|nr:4-(cytidine 5'-diphospho)-2-C-methyl-D-erythritol kinase [Acidobacteriota bacterium]